MNVAVKHNGSTITGRVISYTREHKICTSIGTLDIVLEGTYSASIDPWDTIDIHENGSFQVRYYVSDIARSQSAGTITLQCQDISKRLVDYFIPDSYTIDYPSTTRYWIEKFLDEAGINYNFQTSSQGNLLSNYTALGLQPAYDQITMLLQLSGWYMYFDGNGVAIIGSLDVDLADTAGSLGRTDILEIKKHSHDKMLRNRALVWGEFNPFTQSYAFADVKKMTPWNYDSRDIRTMVISNHNIPNSSSAHSIANILVKEFAKITVEKHITAWGARNFDLGDAVRVNTDVWRGKGLITTFGVSMGRDGLVTNLVLDERCPRLFGFFNFGDYVYVGMFGDGVWRKHIRFDHTWYNFSSGLTDLNITDLHINNGIFGAVGHSGEMFYTNTEAGPWYPIATPLSLPSATEDEPEITESGVYETTEFSGIMARAVIVDKITNSVKFAVDNWSGLNTGDYFLTYSSFFATTSGVITSGGGGDNRGWILEYDPYTGELLIDDTLSGIYPISYSGNFDIRVLDLENDGLNDYVSVKTSSANAIESSIYGWNFGKSRQMNSGLTQDTDSLVSFGNFARLSNSGNSLHSTTSSNMSSMSVFDNESAQEREVVWWQGSAAHRYSIDNSMNPTTLNSPTIASPTGTPIGVSKLTTDSYRFFRLSSAGDVDVTNHVLEFSYIDWDAAANTLSGQVSLGGITINRNTFHGAFQNITVEYKIIQGVIYWYAMHLVDNTFPNPLDPDYTSKSNNYVNVYKASLDMSTSTMSAGLVFSQTFNPGVNGGDGWSIAEVIRMKVYQVGDHPSVYFMIKESNITAPHYYNWFISATGGTTFNSQVVQDSATPTAIFGSDTAGASGQLTGENFFHLAIDTFGVKSVHYNGESLSFGTLTSLPWQATPANIYPLFGQYDNYYIAVNGTDWYFCNPQTLTPDTLFVPPFGYTITKPYSTTDSLSPRYYWQARNAVNARVILKTTESAMLEECQPDSSYTGAQSGRGFICGNFFINLSATSNTTMSILYLNNNVDVPDSGDGFLLLQRDGMDFNLIRSSAKPIRIDISNNAPALSVLDTEDSFMSDFIYEQELTRYTPTSGLMQTEVRDYRYTLLETLDDGSLTSSGAGIQTQILFVTDSGIWHTDATFSGAFAILDAVTSGGAERIETSNFTYPGQYIFTTTSGEEPRFFQRDNDGIVFTYYSGLPSSRATIIRVDDRL